jgi:hypothetical protein
MQDVVLGGTIGWFPGLSEVTASQPANYIIAIAPVKSDFPGFVVS